MVWQWKKLKTVIQRIISIIIAIIAGASVVMFWSVNLRTVPDFGGMGRLAAKNEARGLGLTLDVLQAQDADDLSVGRIVEPARRDFDQPGP